MSTRYASSSYGSSPVMMRASRVTSSDAADPGGGSSERSSVRIRCRSTLTHSPNAGVSQNATPSMKSPRHNRSAVATAGAPHSTRWSTKHSPASRNRTCVRVISSQPPTSARNSDSASRRLPLALASGRSPHSSVASVERGCGPVLVARWQSSARVLAERMRRGIPPTDTSGEPSRSMVSDCLIAEQARREPAGRLFEKAHMGCVLRDSPGG